MPAFALSIPLESHALRSAPWASEIAPRFIDVLDGRTIPRATPVVENPSPAGTAAMQALSVGTTELANVLPNLETIVIGLLDSHIINMGDYDNVLKVIYSSTEHIEGAFSQVNSAITAITSAFGENPASAQSALNNVETSFGQVRTALARIVVDLMDSVASEVSRTAITDAKRSFNEFQNNIGKLQDAINAISSPASSNANLAVSGNLANTASSALENDTASTTSVSTDNFQKWAPLVVGLLGANLGVAVLVVVILALMYLHKRRESGPSPHRSKSSYRPLREPDSDKFTVQTRAGENSWPYSENQ
ncbi:hypothetical protein DL96DRAFT_1715680 [Flagelloscypha sp. PMI_526]|nr:hypothetical protein DL96DRAFT_1715680 [Flagelloscypha sp. PMI_526]